MNNTIRRNSGSSHEFITSHSAVMMMNMIVDLCGDLLRQQLIVIFANGLIPSMWRWRLGSCPDRFQIYFGDHQSILNMHSRHENICSLAHSSEWFLLSQTRTVEQVEIEKRFQRKEKKQLTFTSPTQWNILENRLNTSSIFDLQKNICSYVRSFERRKWQLEFRSPFAGRTRKLLVHLL